MYMEIDSGESLVGAGTRNGSPRSVRCEGSARAELDRASHNRRGFSVTKRSDAAVTSRRRRRPPKASRTVLQELAETLQ
ncbi:hypothetical protein EVAR_102622_1 [Eumeta japonica]|uniref:Uncharacterized protein n=1 Tax=Eumeta variegata TaxID=151549 RepID=A0A4C1TUP9_EUMVA|nr:hypothetical protein EVAR_102622_1 [Eumeta japonica]